MKFPNDLKVLKPKVHRGYQVQGRQQHFKENKSLKSIKQLQRLIFRKTTTILCQTQVTKIR